MVKRLNTKPNILERIRSKNHVNHAKGRNPADKGKYLGSCNKSDCLKPGADWYNHGSLAYYCEGCAYWLNTDRFNRREAQEQWGHTLCTQGKYDPALFMRLHDLHRNAQRAIKEQEASKAEQEPSHA